MEYSVCYDYQFIDVHDGEESQPMQHFHQNLKEAEYIVGLYMFLRLKGCPKEDITILTSYNGQRLLIEDILKARCSSELFGSPSSLTTIDQYQSQENRIILVSLVRTDGPGHNSDPRRLVAALSRAKSSIYVFGKLNVYASLQGEAGVIIRNLLADRGSKLSLRQETGILEVESVEHMWDLLQSEMQRQLKS